MTMIFLTTYFITIGLAFAAQLPPSQFRLQNKIVGGSETDISEYPYQISLQYFGSHICGGSIVSLDMIITAAHCTDGFSASYLSIRAGTSRRSSGGQVISVRRIYQHPKYDPSTINYDISILELSSLLDLNENVAPISLPSKGTSWPVGIPGVVTGWGALSEGGSSPIMLQEVQLNVISQSACQNDYYRFSITKQMLCAGGQGGKDACQGDSGGPFAIYGELAGIVSWGIGCARPGYPGIFTNVAEVRDFITEKTGIK